MTYADLDRLFADLPVSTLSVAAPTTEPAVRPRGRRVLAEPTVVAGMPTALKVLWTVWASVVAINLTVWLLVSLGGSDLAYFWPMWLAVPGVVLLGASAAVTAVRSHRRDRTEG
ncbi:hypothetical protein E4P39_12795 [Blastococcus sp. CT_GayMR19]|nr:hypothetical protein E4P39_12795 [Blastococcus sp. CT_GayMR19]